MVQIPTKKELEDKELDKSLDSGLPIMIIKNIPKEWEEKDEQDSQSN